MLVATIRSQIWEFAGRVRRKAQKVGRSVPGPPERRRFGSGERLDSAAALKAR
jgi:hypothetical protein